MPKTTEATPAKTARAARRSVALQHTSARPSMGEQSAKNTNHACWIAYVRAIVPIPRHATTAAPSGASTCPTPMPRAKLMTSRPTGRS